MRRSVVSLQLKDVLTLINLIGGVLAIRFALQGQVERAGYSILIGSFFGDVFDGAIARATGTANRFGAELDAIADHFVHVIVPALVVYVVFDDAGFELLGLIAAGFLVGMATVRHARLAAQRFDYGFCFCGLPRTISGLAALSLGLSKITGDHLESLHWLVFGLIIAMSLLNVAPVPYMTHRGQRAMQPWVKGVVLLMLGTPMVAFLFDRSVTFDVFGFWLIAYALAGWIPVHPDERRAFHERYRAWSKELAMPSTPR